MDENENSVDFQENNNEKSFQQVYGWYLVLNRIAGNDFTKHEVIYQKNIMEVLNQLSFLIEYDREQDRLRKKAEKGY